MKKSGWVTFVYLLIATILGSIGATPLLALDYVRDSQPKLFSYDELVQLSLDQEMRPELAEKLRVITTTPKDRTCLHRTSLERSPT
jgi:hypothetical protein